MAARDTGAEALPPTPNALDAPDVGLTVIRGGAVRAAGYGVGMVCTAIGAILLLRYLGPADFGRYMTVASLIAIVSGIGDAGLSAVGSRDYAVRRDEADRRQLQRNLLGLRLVIVPVGTLAAVMFAVAAGYEPILVLGTALAGGGLILAVWQSTLTLELSANLQIVRLTLSETSRQLAMLCGIAIAVVLGAGLLGFFLVPLGVGVVLLAATPLLLVGSVPWLPRFHAAEWRDLVRATLPVAASVVMGVLYFRLLIIVMSLTGSAFETGLFATSFRIVELLYGVSSLVATTILPVLAVVAEARERLGYIVQKMTEIGIIAGAYLAITVAILARPLIDLLGGARYLGAVSVLQLQVFALIPVFLIHGWQLALISIRKERALIGANAIALAVAVVLAVTLSSKYGAKGAAVAAVGSEVALALALLAALSRADRSLTPKTRPLAKIAFCVVAAAITALVVELRPVLTAVLTSGVFLALLMIARAVPQEVLDAFALRLRSKR